MCSEYVRNRQIISGTDEPFGEMGDAIPEEWSIILLSTICFRSALTFEGRDNLMIDGRFYKLNNNVYVAAFGKAVAGMVRAAEDMLGDHIVEGYASIPVGLQDVMRKNSKLYVNFVLINDY